MLCQWCANRLVNPNFCSLCCRFQPSRAVKNMGLERECFGLKIIWEGGTKVFVKDGSRIIEEHELREVGPRSASEMIGCIQDNMYRAACGMEERDLP